MSDNSHPGAGGGPPAASLAEMVSDSSAPPLRQSFSAETCTKIFVLGGLFVAMNLWQFTDYLLPKWRNDPNWSHGFLIPLFSLYLLYSSRHAWLTARRRGSAWGLLILIAGVIVTLVGVYPVQMAWASHMGMIVALFGLVWYTAGAGVIRATWLPILFLVFAMPIPEGLYGRIALPLQEIAAAGAEAFMRLIGANVHLIENSSTLEVVSVSQRRYMLTVAEACAGMRLLMAFMALGVAMAYLDEKPIWQRVTLVIMGVPIAVLCNVIRVIITCWMYLIDEESMGKGFMHEFTGLVMLIPALLMLLGLSMLLRRLVVEEDSDESDESGKLGAGAEGVKA